LKPPTVNRIIAVHCPSVLERRSGMLDVLEPQRYHYLDRVGVGVDAASESRIRNVHGPRLVRRSVRNLNRLRRW
jgi:hypothetical protein